MWEMWLLDGLPEQRVALFIRLHHVLADGVAGVASLGAFLDPSPDVAIPAVQPRAPRRRPDTSALLADNLHRRSHAVTERVTTLSHPGQVRGRAVARWRTL